jgi:hypothetical protein
MRHGPYSGMSTFDKVAARKEYDKLEHEGEACTSAHLYLARCR